MSNSVFVFFFNGNRRKHKGRRAAGGGGLRARSSHSRHVFRLSHPTSLHLPTCFCSKACVAVFYPGNLKARWQMSRPSGGHTYTLTAQEEAEVRPWGEPA